MCDGSMGPWQTGPGGRWTRGRGVWELMTQSDRKSALGAVWVARPGIDDLKTRGLWGGQCGVMVSVRYQYNPCYITPAMLYNPDNVI